MFQSIILPQILSTLGSKPGRCEHLDSLYDDVLDNVSSKYPDVRLTEIHKALKKALDEAQRLGIISIANEELSSMSLDDRANLNREDMDVAVDDSMDNADVNATNEKSRRKSPATRKRSPLNNDNDDHYFMMTPTKNVVKRNHISATDRMVRRRSARVRRPKRGRSSRRMIARRRASTRRR